MTATITGNGIDVEPSPYGDYAIDVICTFDVENTTYAPASLRAKSAIVIDPYNYESTSHSIDIEVPARSVQIGQYNISYRGYGYPGYTFHVRDTVTDITANQPANVLVDAAIDSFIIANNGGVG